MPAEKMADRVGRTDRVAPGNSQGIRQEPDTFHFLILGAILFAIGVVGIFLNRKNLIVLLMAIELMLLAVNMNFVAFRTTSGTSPARIRFLHPDGGCCRIGHRVGHPGRPVPQPEDASTWMIWTA